MKIFKEILNNQEGSLQIILDNSLKTSAQRSAVVEMVNSTLVMNRKGNGNWMEKSCACRMLIDLPDKFWAGGEIVGYKSKMLHAVMLFYLLHLAESTLYHSNSAAQSWE